MEFGREGSVQYTMRRAQRATLYLCSKVIKAYALDGKTGAKQWEFETEGAVQSSLAIGNGGTGYVGSNDKKVYVLDG